MSRVLKADFQALGPRTLKNIAHPVDVFAIAPADGGAGPGVTAPNAVDLTQEIRFCTAPDGVQLAYSRIGQGPPLMKTGNWMTHLEFDLEKFLGNLDAVNPGIETMLVSAKTGEGVDAFRDWLVGVGERAPARA